MKLTITQSNKHYIVAGESGLTLRILTKKAFVWNLKHTFGLKTEDVKAIDESLKAQGTVRIAV